MSITTEIVVPQFGNTLGALLLGGTLATALWGVTCIQIYNYYMDVNKDPPWLKFLVAMLWVLDTFNEALIIHALYFYAVLNYVNPKALLKPVWSVIIYVGMTAVSNYVIRAMFLTRVYRLSKKNLWVVGGILALSTADLVITLTICIKAFNFSSFVELNNISALIYTSFGSGTGADLCLALVLLYLLYRSRTGFKKTNSLIRVLMMYTVNTGMIVAVDAALGVIAYAAMPHNFIFLGFYLLSSKLYVNAYVAMLNARKSLRNDRDELISFKLTNVTSNPIAASPFRQRDTKATMVEKGSRADTGKTAVTITTLVEQHHDQDAASV